VSLWAGGQSLPEIIEAGESVGNAELVNALYKMFLAFRDKDWRGVEQASIRAMELDPRHEYSNYLLGTSLLEDKRYAESQAPLLISVGSAPHYLGARYRLGRALMLNKRHAYAKLHFMTYLKSNPKAHIVLMMLSDIYTLEGNIELATKYLAESLECGGDEEKISKRLAKLAA
jgi:tetratricopeptide (TPR) repeat protein